MKPLVVDSIATRTLLVLVIGLALSHILSIALYFTDRNDALKFAGGEHVAESMLTLSRLIESAPSSDRDRIARMADDPKLHVMITKQSMIENPAKTVRRENALRDSIATRLQNDEHRIIISNSSNKDFPDTWRRHVRQQHGTDFFGEMLFVSFGISDQDWLNFAALVKSPDSIWSFRFGLSMAVMLLSIIIFTSLIVRYLTKPLETFSHAAQRLGTDVNAPPLPEVGPIEVRRATRAFNEMQSRIKRYLDDHTQMIAAISHDLGTPITRLRLRGEFIEDTEQKQKMLSDLDDMEKMVDSALSLAREEANSEPQVMVDLRTLVQRVCDDLVDLDRNVFLNADRDPVPFRCRPVALRRALTNLVENAAKYGEQARVSLVSSTENVKINIEDNGPGIPEDLLEAAFKPFHRLETSRNPETGGTGLGLTVARTIIRSHGGEVTLKNIDKSGLLVEVLLPR